MAWFQIMTMARTEGAVLTYAKSERNDTKSNRNYARRDLIEMAHHIPEQLAEFPTSLCPAGHQT